MNFIKGKAAKKLYSAAKMLPIVDYHCHLSPREIYEDRVFSDIGEIWLSGDHYKWRLMRTAGIDEKYITGDEVSYKEKFLRYASAVEFAAGHPLYHWSHMELEKYFDIRIPLNSVNAPEIWDKANGYIKRSGMSPRKLIEKSNVEIICTTDDITDDLKWHKKLAEDKSVKFKVLPTFRTDNLILVQRDGYTEYIERLSDVSGVEVNDLKSLKAAVKQRLDYFVQCGCRCSDVGIPLFPSRIADEAEGDMIFCRLLENKAITEDEYNGLIGNLYVYLNGLYRERNIIAQWHLAVIRNANTILADRLGADCGVDCVGNAVDGNALIYMLDEINKTSGLPKVVIYTLNEANVSQLSSVAAAFPNVKLGAAWWFCDHKRGIEDMIVRISEGASLGSFYGMLTDSRSFLSYARHDYFRQILCSMIGKWVDDGEYDGASAGKLVEKICYTNIKNDMEKTV